MDREYLTKLCNARDCLCGFCEADECEKCIVTHLIDDAYNELPEEDEGEQKMENNRFVEDGKFKVRQFSADICSIFEDLLADYDIYIPSEDREGAEGEACLYGTEYSAVEDGVTEILVKLIEELKKNPDIEIDDEDY